VLVHVGVLLALIRAAADAVADPLVLVCGGVTANLSGETSYVLLRSSTCLS